MIFDFKVYILPLLDYCSPIWSPFRLNDIDRIEKVQRAFTKKLYGLCLLSYPERLRECKLPSLELRRLWSDLMLCFKIHTFIDLNFDDFFELESSMYNTRGHIYKLRIPKVNNCIRKNFFSVRVLPVWNYLPSDVVTATSISVFKTKIESIDLGKFLTRKYELGSDAH